MRCTLEPCNLVSVLQRRALDVAVFSLLGNIFVLVYTSCLTNGIRTIMAIYETDPYEFQTREFVEMNSYDELFALFTMVVSATLSTLALLLLVSIVAVLLDLLLFIGALRQRRDFVQCWLWGRAVISGVYFLQFWEISMKHFAGNDISTGSLILVATLLGVVVTACLCTEVHSYNLELLQRDLSVDTKGAEPHCNRRFFVPFSLQRSDVKTCPELFTPL